MDASSEPAGVTQRRTYQPPSILAELILESRAGSPLLLESLAIFAPYPE